MAGDLPIGDNREAMAKFEAEFAGVFEDSKWKLTRIISTTVNKMRNIASVNYMNEAGVDQFEIVGIPDRLQCGYCAALQGKKFSVSKALDNVLGMVKAEPTMVGSLSPFITAVYKSPADLEGVSEADLQLNGIGMPPFHSHCRDQAVAIL